MSNDEKIKKAVFSKMAARCSRSEQCTPDIHKKIIASGLTDADAEEILDQLKAEKFIDDGRYAKAYVAEKFGINKWGRIKIRYYLRGKGLDSVAIENGLKELDEEKYKKALLKTMKEKARRVNKKTKFEKMGPIIRFAQSRGYEPELIHRYINEVVK